MWLRCLPVLACALLVSACEGPAGPIGPQGPIGPPGPQGPPAPGFVRLTYTLTTTSGGADQVLPADAGNDPRRPPSLTCYLAESATSGVWLAIADGFSTTSSYCALVLENGRWRAAARRTPSGWVVAMIVTFPTP
jgi:hypothetical protein